MFKISKNNSHVLFFILFFSLATTTCIYGSPQGYAMKEYEKSKITNASRDVFLSKCNDRNTDIKEVCKAYKGYRKAVKISNKARIVVEEKFFEDFKEDYFEYISREQQKDIEAAYRAFIRAIRRGDKASEAVVDALYKLAKVNRIYYKIKKADADYRIEKAKKHFDKLMKNSDVLREAISVASEFYVAKAKVIGEGDNIFTRVRKHQEEGR